MGKVKGSRSSANSVRSSEHGNCQDENGIVRTVPDKPEKMRDQQWSNRKQQTGRNLVDYIDFKKHFSFRPYASTPQGVAEAKLHADLGRDTVVISSRGVVTELLSWSAIITTTLFPLVTESKAGTISYNPQRMMQELGYDQSAIRLTGKMGCSDSTTVESQFVGDGKAHILSKSQTIFWLMA